MDKYLISSVLGFNLKIEIRDQDGCLVPSGIKRTIVPAEKSERTPVKLFDRSFFTSFNEDLLNKVIYHRRLND
jgi:hypothetical protein